MTASNVVIAKIAFAAVASTVSGVIIGQKYNTEIDKFITTSRDNVKKTYSDKKAALIAARAAYKAALPVKK